MRTHNPLSLPFYQTQMLLTATHALGGGDNINSALSLDALLAWLAIWPVDDAGAPWPIVQGEETVTPPCVRIAGDHQVVAIATGYDPAPRLLGVNRPEPSSANPLTTHLELRACDGIMRVLTSYLAVHGQYPDTPRAAFDEARIRIRQSVFDPVREDFPSAQFLKAKDGSAIGLLLLTPDGEKRLLFHHAGKPGTTIHTIDVRLLGESPYQQAEVERLLATLTDWVDAYAPDTLPLLNGDVQVPQG
ncbi:MAG: hypothetical protein ABI743_03925 [bacterium]